MTTGRHSTGGCRIFGDFMFHQFNNEVQHLRVFKGFRVMMSGLCQNPINTLQAMREICCPSLKAKANLCERSLESSKEIQERSQESLNATFRPFARVTTWPTKLTIGPVTGRKKAELMSVSRMKKYVVMSANILSAAGLPSLSPDGLNFVTLRYQSAMKQSTNGSMPMPGISSLYWSGLTATESAAGIPGATRKPTSPREFRFGNGLPMSYSARKSGIGKPIRLSPDKALLRFKSALKEKHASQNSANYQEKALTK
jgi:hypothetical protein